MKKVVAILLLALSASTAMAQHYHGNGIRHPHYRGHYYGGGWVAPLIIGGAVGYALTRPAPVIVEQPPVYVQPQPTPMVQSQCTRYIFQDQYGQTIREEVRCN